MWNACEFAFVRCLFVFVELRPKAAHHASQVVRRVGRVRLYTLLNVFSCIRSIAVKNF